MQNRLKELRLSKKITQVELAKHLSVSQGTLSFWEQGKYEPDNKSLTKLADFFGVSVDYLLGKTDIKKTPHGSEALQQLLDESNAHMAVVIGKGKERRIIEVPADAEEISLRPKTLDDYVGQEKAKGFKNKEK